MKRFTILLAVLLFSTGLFAQSTTPIYTDTASFKISTATSGIYAVGDVVRDTATTTSRFLKLKTFTKMGCLQGQIMIGKLETDTAGTPGGIFDLLLFTDTTGMNALLPANNALYQNNYAFSSKYIDKITFSLSAIGTAAGGASLSRSNVEYVGIVLDQRTIGRQYVWGLLIAQGTFTPAYGGRFKVTLSTYQF